MRYTPVQIASIDAQNTLVDSVDPTRCKVALRLTRAAPADWRELFEKAFKLPVDWSTDDIGLTFRTERAAAGHWVGQAIAAARSVNGAVEGGFRPFIEAQQELDEWLRAAAAEYRIGFGDDPPVIFEFST